MVYSESWLDHQETTMHQRGWICRGLFATHYHRLADAHDHDPNVAICHMGCSVEDSMDGEPEQVKTQFSTLRHTLLMNCACSKNATPAQLC